MKAIKDMTDKELIMEQEAVDSSIEKCCLDPKSLHYRAELECEMARRGIEVHIATTYYTKNGEEMEDV